MSEWIKPDEFYQINIEGWETPVVVNAKYDRVDYWKPVGQWVLKVYDDEVGLMTMFVDENTARRVVEYAELPVVERDTIFESEMDGFLRCQSQGLDDELDELE